jgi:hypothetical protein
MFEFFFRKAAERIEGSLKSDKNDELLHEDLFRFMIIRHLVLFRITYISVKSCRESKKTRFMSVTFVFEIRADCEITLKIL